MAIFFSNWRDFCIFKKIVNKLWKNIYLKKIPTFNPKFLEISCWNPILTLSSSG
jgi:hypothetical protein